MQAVRKNYDSQLLKNGSRLYCSRPCAPTIGADADVCSPSPQTPPPPSLATALLHHVHSCFNSTRGLHPSGGKYGPPVLSRLGTDPRGHQRDRLPLQPGGGVQVQEEGGSHQTLVIKYEVQDKPNEIRRPAEASPRVATPPP